MNIGTTTDSDDDTARLMLVTAYAGSRMVNVYAIETGNALTGLVVGNRIDFTPNNDTDDNFVTLTAVGMFYLAGEANANDGLDATDRVADDATAVQVFSYPDPTSDTEETIYVVFEPSTTTATGRTEVMYRLVDITADHDDDVESPEQWIQAPLAEATDYKHMNFGVWAALGEAKASDGSQDPAALGVGFVNALATGDGMTAVDDMPNHGRATYEGDWVAAVQNQDPGGDGTITLETGAATLTAEFEDGDFTAMLTGLATLKGGITGNTFLGDEADIMPGELQVAPGNLLDADADFTSTLNGGFFGSKAAEAGDVFAFATKDNKGGAFTGAFGGRR